MFERDGVKFPCPDCGEVVTIEFGDARCEACGWSACDAELDEILEDEILEEG